MVGENLSPVLHELTDSMPLNLLQPFKLLSASDVLSRPSAAPAEPGIYAWYFSEVPGEIDASDCFMLGDRKLLYVGISPSAPPLNGKAPSRSTIRNRLQQHFGGNAEGSTLRLTLGCLLSQRLGIKLRRVGSGTRYTFTNPGEQLLDDWLALNASVACHPCERPWEVEHRILASGLSLPLNIAGNPCAAHVNYLSPMRRSARAHANLLDIVADNGGPRRFRPRRNPASADR